jgi:G3E family GTPase
MLFAVAKLYPLERRQQPCGTGFVNHLLPGTDGREAVQQVLRRFLSQDADRDRMTVVLLSGFLGSGKTTLVNALLRDPRLADTAVAVNEFGAVPLDHALIDHGEDRTVVMANGCLCCNLSGDLEGAVMRLFSRRESGALPGFRRLIIEPSGLSDPAPIAQAILRNPMMARALRLEAIVTTVDAVFAPAQLARHPETQKQVALADVLVLTKTDLAGADGIARTKDALAGLNRTAPVLTAHQGEVDAACLFPAGFLDPASASAPPRSGLFAERVLPEGGDPGHAARVAAVSLSAEQALRWPEFETWLRGIRLGHAEQLLRMKGMLAVAGMDGPVVVHGVHHVLHAPVALDRWPDADRRSRLVMIADAATTDAIQQSWAAALPGMTQ